MRWEENRGSEGPRGESAEQASDDAEEVKGPPHSAVRSLSSLEGGDQDWNG